MAWEVASYVVGLLSSHPLTPQTHTLTRTSLQMAWEVASYVVGILSDNVSGLSDEQSRVKYRAMQLRDMLTRLGPTFIKAGQVRGC